MTRTIKNQLKLFISNSLLYVLVIYIQTADLYACTAITITKGGSIVLAKNFDFETDQGFWVYNPSGIQKESIIYSNKKLTWTSKFASITNNIFGIDFPLGGMNEDGLVLEELSMPGFTAVPDTSKFQINEFQFVQYILDNCANTDEVKNILQELQITPQLFAVHYMVTDRFGETIIIEPDSEGIKIITPSDKNHCVLSNNMFNNSVKYLKNFKGFGGKEPVVKRKGSNERFVFANYLLETVTNCDIPILAKNILDSVKQSDTRWQIFYNPQDMQIIFRHHKCLVNKSIDFKNFEIHSHSYCFDIFNDCNITFEQKPTNIKQYQNIIDDINEGLKQMEWFEKIKPAIQKIQNYGFKIVKH